MERKLELLDIKSYIDSDLEVMYFSRRKRVVGFRGNSLFLEDDIDGISMGDISDCVPLLRSMDKLILPVESSHFAGTIIPLICMAKARHPELQGENEDQWSHSLFFYEGTWFVKSIMGCHNKILYNDTIFKTKGEFDILDKLHFDYNGLIPMGLAIDIDTIKG